MNNFLKFGNECFAASARVCLNEAPSVVNQRLHRTQRYPPFLWVLVSRAAHPQVVGA